MQDTNKLSVTATRKIEKYNEGDTPGIDEPFEVLEFEETYAGEEALAILEQFNVKGGNNHGTN